MNMALAADEAQYGYGRNTTVEDAMQVLANAGYTAENWMPLTTGYQVYWYDEANRCILYNSTTGEIEYPEEFIGAKTKDGSQYIILSDHIHIYNEFHAIAQKFDMSLGSAISVGSDNKISSTSISGSGDEKTYSISSTTTTIKGVAISSSTQSSQNNLKALASASAQDVIKASLGVEDSSLSSVYMYATKENISADPSGAYASLQISSVGTEPTLTNSGEVKENLYYLSIANKENGTPEQIAAAKKAAAQYIYTIFDQITAGKIDDNISILVEPGIEIDCSLDGAEWAPCKTFQGYFGTTDAANPIVINGASLSTKTGYSQTVRFEGTNSYYFVTGFFGTVFGNTTIENVTFKNIQIATPAVDYQLINTTKTNSRNCVGIIGGITDGFEEENSVQNADKHYSGTIKLSNLKVESSCEISGKGTAAGLVGYIGCASSADHTGKDVDGNDFSVSVVIDNCHVSAKVSSVDTESKAGYADVGGITGLHCRSSKFDITINNTTFDGSVNGYHAVSAICGDAKNQSSLTLSGNISTENATINNLGTAKFAASVLNANDVKWSQIHLGTANLIVSSDYHQFCSNYGSNVAANVGYYSFDGDSTFTKIN